MPDRLTPADIVPDPVLDAKFETKMRRVAFFEKVMAGAWVGVAVSAALTGMWYAVVLDLYIAVLTYTRVRDRERGFLYAELCEQAAYARGRLDELRELQAIDVERQAYGGHFDWEHGVPTDAG